MYRPRVVTNTSQINKDNWDALVDDNVFISWGWLQTVEQTFLGEVSPRYVLVYDDASLVGASACYIFHKSSQTYSLDDWLFGRLKKFLGFVGLSFLPALICSPAKCDGSHFLVKKDAKPEEKKSIMEELLRTMEKEAYDHKLSIGFPHVIDVEDELIRLLDENGYTKTVDHPFTYLNIQWSSFDEYRNYVKKLHRNMKRLINQEINRNRKKGVVIKRLASIDRYENRLAELLNNTYRKHNNISFPYKSEFIRTLTQNFGDDAVIYIAVKKDEVIGVCVLLKKNNSGHLSFVGIDHEMAGNDFTYFNIGYYRPISDAINGDIKRLYFGKLMYETKMRRGCRISHTYILYKPYNSLMNIPVKIWLSIHSSWMRRKLPQSHNKQ